MAQDCFVIRATAAELAKRLEDARIDKIFMPHKDKLVMSMRAKEGNIKVLFEAGNIGKVHITSQKFENPESPPMLCMLLRKHLTSGRIIKISQPGFERMIEFSVLSADEMGDVTEKHLYIEMMGRRNNVILADEENRILGCMKKVDTEMSPERPVLPGLTYGLPPKQDKINLLDDDEEAVLKAVRGLELTPKIIMDRIGGISPLMAREFCYKAEKYNDKCENQLIKLRNMTAFNEFQPVFIEKNGEKIDYSAFFLEQYEFEAVQTRAQSFSSLLDDFYSERLLKEQRKNLSSELLRTIQNALERQTRKLANQKNELLTAQAREDIKKKADLIMSNIHIIKKGMRAAVLTDYFDEELKQVTVTLDERKTPQQNAQRLYDMYGRMKNAEIMLSQQIEKGEQELVYLESLVSLLENAQNSLDISAIKEELSENGYIKNKGKNLKKPKQKKINLRKFTTTDGFTVLCGRNNIENDMLTMKQADFKDIWFHSKNVPGSHVVLVCDGREPTEDAIEQAAALAAYFSKLSSDTLASIDYTMVKNVKKYPEQDREW